MQADYCVSAKLPIRTGGRPWGPTCILYADLPLERVGRTGQSNTRGTQDLFMAACASRDVLEITMCASASRAVVRLLVIHDLVEVYVNQPLQAFKRSTMEHATSDYWNIDYERLGRDAEDIHNYYMNDIRNEGRLSGLSIARIHGRARRRRDTLKTASAPTLDTFASTPRTLNVVKTTRENDRQRTGSRSKRKTIS